MPRITFYNCIVCTMYKQISSLNKSDEFLRLSQLSIIAFPSPHVSLSVTFKPPQIISIFLKNNEFKYVWSRSLYFKHFDELITVFQDVRTIFVACNRVFLQFLRRYCPRRAFSRPFRLN